PFFDLSSLLEAYLTSVKALATPIEFSYTLQTVAAFKEPGSVGRCLYERAAAMASDPNIENWEWKLQLRHAHLNCRAPLVPFNSFWFSHPLSTRIHAPAERAVLTATTLFGYMMKLDAGEMKPLALNEQELATVYHKWIFNATRKPCLGSDEMIKAPRNDYCVVFRKASWVGILMSDNRQTWAEVRSRLSSQRRPGAYEQYQKRGMLRQLDAQNVKSIATIEAAALIICLDDASPTNATERAKQFHFGGKMDAANHWNDKSLQFVVCTYGVSGVIGEHTMLDALTLTQLNKAMAMAIQKQPATAHSLAEQIQGPHHCL
ncbi:hypothetical protein BKA66DRAFT_586007, partial [Pyrenochaeta sp. MPI-SDFR-AT-0127]